MIEKKSNPALRNPSTVAAIEDEINQKIIQLECAKVEVEIAVTARDNAQ